MEYRRYRYSTRFMGDGDETTVYAREVPHGYTLEVTYFAVGHLENVKDPWELGYEDNANNQIPLARTNHTEQRETKVEGRVWLEADERPYAKSAEIKTTEEAFITVHGKLWPTKEKIAKDAEVHSEDNLPNDS